MECTQKGQLIIETTYYCCKSFQPKSLETSCSLKQKATKPGSWMRWLGDQRRSAFFRSLDDDGCLVGWGLFGSLSILKESSGGPIEEEGKRRDALLCRRIEDLMRCFRSFVA